MSLTMMSNSSPASHNAKRLVRAVDGGHHEAGRGKLRRQQVAEEGTVVDQQQALLAADHAVKLLRAEPVGGGLAQEIAGIDDLRRLTGDHGAADAARRLGAEFDIELGFDDVDDLVDHQAHRMFLILEHQYRLTRTVGRQFLTVLHGDEGHELAAILHDPAAVRLLDRLPLDLLEAGDQSQRHGLRRESPARNSSSGTFSSLAPRDLAAILSAD